MAFQNVSFAIQFFLIKIPKKFERSFSKSNLDLPSSEAQ